MNNRDIYAYYKGLHAGKRIELLTGILHISHPLEVRFVNTLCEYLRIRDDQVLVEAQTRANNPQEFKQIVSSNLFAKYPLSCMPQHHQQNIALTTHPVQGSAPVTLVTAVGHQMIVGGGESRVSPPRGPDQVLESSAQPTQAVMNATSISKQGTENQSNVLKQQSNELSDPIVNGVPDPDTENLNALQIGAQKVSRKLLKPSPDISMQQPQLSKEMPISPNVSVQVPIGLNPIDPSLAKPSSAKHAVTSAQVMSAAPSIAVAHPAAPSHHLLPGQLPPPAQIPPPSPLMSAASVQPSPPPSCARSRLIVALTLMHHSNRDCAELAFRTITEQLSCENIGNLVAQCELWDYSEQDYINDYAGTILTNRIYDELLLILYIAINHPAFTHREQTALWQQLYQLVDYLDNLIDQQHRARRTGPYAENAISHHSHPTSHHHQYSEIPMDAPHNEVIDSHPNVNNKEQYYFHANQINTANYSHGTLHQIAVNANMVSTAHPSSQSYRHNDDSSGSPSPPPGMPGQIAAEANLTSHSHPRLQKQLPAQRHANYSPQSNITTHNQQHHNDQASDDISPSYPNNNMHSNSSSLGRKETRHRDLPSKYERYDGRSARDRDHSDQPAIDNPRSEANSRIGFNVIRAASDAARSAANPKHTPGYASESRSRNVNAGSPMISSGVKNAVKKSDSYSTSGYLSHSITDADEDEDSSASNSSSNMRHPQAQHYHLSHQQHGHPHQSQSHQYPHHSHHRHHGSSTTGQINHGSQAAEASVNSRQTSQVQRHHSSHSIDASSTPSPHSQSNAPPPMNYTSVPTGSVLSLSSTSNSTSSHHRYQGRDSRESRDSRDRDFHHASPQLAHNRDRERDSHRH